jgi:hypothetical protein
MLDDAFAPIEIGTSCSAIALVPGVPLFRSIKRPGSAATLPAWHGGMISMRQTRYQDGQTWRTGGSTVELWEMEDGAILWLLDETRTLRACRRVIFS